MFYSFFTTISTTIYYFNNSQNSKLFKIIKDNKSNNTLFILSLSKIIHNLEKNKSSREIIFIIKKITSHAYKQNIISK